MSEVKTPQENRGYPLWMCHHGHKPEYCAKCLIAGVIPPLERNKGTGHEEGGGTYIYIQPERKFAVEEKTFDEIDNSEESPRDSVEILIPPSRPPRTEPLVET